MYEEGTQEKDDEEEGNGNISPGEFDSVDGSLIGGNIIYGEFETRKNKINLVDDNLMVKSGSFKKWINKGDSDTKDEDGKSWSNTKSYALATLDGTIMLVKDEIILWFVITFFY